METNDPTPGPVAAEVIAALRDLSTPRQVLGDRLAELNSRPEGWFDDLIGEVPDWLVDNEEGHLRFDFEYRYSNVAGPPALADFEAAIREFIDGADPNWHVIPEKIRQLNPLTGKILGCDMTDLLADRSPIDRDLSEARAGVARAKEPLDAAFVAVRDQLHEWLDDVLAGAGAAPADWGHIQKAWRVSLALPMRQAATLLDVSSAAVARYETGTRNPSLEGLRSMVARMVDVGPTAGLEQERLIRVLRAQGYDLPLDDDDTPSVVASIEDRLESLTASQLRFIDALTSDPSALNEFINWTAKAPTRLLRTMSRSVETA